MITTERAGPGAFRSGSGGGADGGSAERLPGWFVTGLVAALALFVAFGAIGLLLAIAGAMAPATTLGLGGVAFVLLLRALAPWRWPAARDRAAEIPAALAVAVSGAAAVFAVVHHASHVLVDRDPGVYVVTARWLSTHHALDLRPGTRIFGHTATLYFRSPGIYQHAGRLTFQFNHLTSTLLAQARWLGGDAVMLALPPVIGALGLLCFYALATRFVRPWVALAATAALATNLVEVHFMRDAYSELPTQVGLLGGMWLLTRTDRVKPAAAAFTGLLLGTAVMARIDGPLYLVAIPLVVGSAAMALRRHDPDAGDLAGAARWFVAGVAVTVVIGYADVSLRSPKYVASLGDRVPLEYAGLVGGCIVAVVIARFAPRLGGWVASTARGRLPAIGGALVALALLAGWIVRPLVQQTTKPFRHFTAEVEAQERFYGIVAGGVRTRFERTLVWQAAYLGPIVLALAIAGVALLVYELLRGKGGRRGLVTATFLPAAAIYLWNPNIYSDQIWVMRRYLPYILPCFVLFAFVIVDRLWSVRRDDTLRLAARVVGVVAVVAAIAWPIRTVVPVRNDSTQHDFVSAVDRVCRAIGPRAAVVVLAGGGVDHVLPQTLRSFCNVPVAIGGTRERAILPLSEPVIVDIARHVAKSRRTLFVVADSVATIRRLLPDAVPTATVSASDSTLLRQQVGDRPHTLVPERYRFVVAPVPTGAP